MVATLGPASDDPTTIAALIDAGVVRAIIAISRSGSTTAVMSASRPAAPLVAASPSLHLRRVSRLLWGTRPVPIAPEDFDDAPAFARRIALELGFAEPGQYILLVRGFSDDPALNMPSITTLMV